MSDIASGAPHPEVVDVFVNPLASQPRPPEASESISGSIRRTSSLSISAIDATSLAVKLTPVLLVVVMRAVMRLESQSPRSHRNRGAIAAHDV